jgi:hypothetical protein
MSKGIALETIELGNRPDQNKKEGSNQKSQFGMKGEKSLLRLGDLFYQMPQSQAGIDSREVRECGPKPSTAINPLAPIASIPA